MKESLANTSLHIAKHIIPRNKAHRQEFYKIILQNINSTFVEAIPLLIILGLAAGVTVAFQAQMGLSLLGKHDKLGQILVFILLREVTPLVTTMVIIARSVTAVSSELATMKVQQEIKALEVLGIDIYEYIWAPRTISGILSLFCMAVFFCFFAFLGSWIGVNWSSSFSLMQFGESIARAITPADILFFIIKPILIGGAIYIVGIKKGLSVKSAPHEVPEATHQAIVIALFYAFIFQLVISWVFYIIHGVNL